MTDAEAEYQVIRMLKDKVSSFAQKHPTTVLLMMLSVLLEMVCLAQGPDFVARNKIKFYKTVLGMLKERGIE